MFESVVGTGLRHTFKTMSTSHHDNMSSLYCHGWSESFSCLELLGSVSRSLFVFVAFMSHVEECRKIYPHIAQP